MARLDGVVAVVAGASRGAGRGIAVELGAAGATVYVTARSSTSGPTTGNRPETIEETAALVTAEGGTGIAVRCDHTVASEVAALFARVRQEQGRLDLLVNNVWGGDVLTNWEQPFWQQDLAKGLQMQVQGVHSHLITSYYGIPLLLERGAGLIIEITDGDSPNYRGNLFYDLVKSSVIRIALALGEELRERHVTAVALTPGYMRTEAILEGKGATEANWQEKLPEIERTDAYFKYSETPRYVGRAVVALAADPDVAKKTGQALHVHKLAEEYGFRDVGGVRPLPWGS